MKNVKRIAIAGLSALTLAAGFTGTASAQAYNHRGDSNHNDRNDRRDNRVDNHRGNDQWNRQWRRGERLPSGYSSHYREIDWRRAHYRAPPRGYHYVRDSRGETLLVGIATGAILGVILGNAF